MELNIDVQVRGAAARRELAELESGIKQVEKAGSSTEAALTKVTKALSGQNTETQNVTRSYKILDDTSKSMGQRADELAKSWAAEARAKADAKIAAEALTTQHVALRGATLGLTTATSAMVGGLAIAATVTAAGAAIIVKSTKHYFDHAEATRDSRKALDEFGQSWDAFQMMVGGAVLGDNFSIAAPMKAVNASLVTMGALLAARISEYQYWLSLVGNNPMDSLRKVPDVMPGTFSGQGLKMWQNRMTEFTTLTATSPTEAWRLFEDSQRAQARAATSAAAESARAAKETAQAAANIRAFWSAFESPGVAGIPGWGPSRAPWFSPEATIGIQPDWSVMLPGGGYATPGMPAGFWGGSSATGVWPSVVPPGATQTAGRGGFSSPFSNPFAGRSGDTTGDRLMSAYQTAMALANGAMNTWDATGQGGTWSRVGGGAMNGLQTGMMFGPAGAAIGAGVGALVGAIRGWLAPTDYEKRVRQEQQDRVGANELLARPGLEAQWTTLGGNAPFDFAFLKSQAFHDPTAILGYLDAMDEKTQKLNAAMEEYGFTWQDLGDKGRQAQLDLRFDALLEKTTILRDAGIDYDEILRRQALGYSELVNAAMDAGDEIPASMRKTIEDMIALGVLVDENGVAFGSLEDSGITFAKTMTQGFNDVSTAIEHLAIALGYVPDRLDDITHAANQAGDALGGMPAGPYYGGTESPEYLPPAYHTGGLVTPTGPESFTTGGCLVSGSIFCLSPAA